MVENTGGRRVRPYTLQGRRIGRYCTLAPPEWNLYPNGTRASGLENAAAGSVLAERTGLLVAALDPRIEYAARVAGRR